MVVSITAPRISPDRIGGPVFPHGCAIDHGFPAFIEAPRQFRLPLQQPRQAELSMRLLYLFVPRKPRGYILPAIGHAAGIEQDDAVADDAEVLQMRINGKDTELPSTLPRIEKPIEPEFHGAEVSRRRQPRKPAVECIFDPLGCFINGKP